MRGISAISLLLALASCGSSTPVTTTVSPGVHPDLVRSGECRLSDGTIAGEGVTTDSDDDCNDCTCQSGRWRCTERDCG